MGVGFLPSGKEGWKQWGLRALLFLLLVACTWPIAGITGGPGQDPSWAVGLQMALSEGMVWGRDIIWTYGPLGVSVHPIAVTSGTLFWSLLIAGAVQFLLVGVLYVALRRQYGLIASTLLTFLLAGAVGAVHGGTLVSSFGLAALAVTVPKDKAQHAGWALALGGGALAAFALLVKLNEGIAAALIVVVALAAVPSPKRALALGLGTGLLTLVVLWLLTGQPLFALSDYGRNAIETVNGYVEAMGLEEAGEAGKWQLLVILGSAATLGALAWRSFPKLGNRRRGALVIGILLMHYFVLREVFVRHNLARGADLALLLPVALMVPWPRQRRGLSLSIAAVLLVSFLASFPRSPERIWSPRAHAKTMVDQLRAAIDGRHLDQLVVEGQALVKGADRVPAKVIRALRGRCVNAEPFEIAVIWAYDLDWCPLPAMQSYTAYTSRLDKLDADRYADPELGPDGVIRNYYAIDGRLSAWESPAAMLSLLCNFTLIAQGTYWQALARVPDRCGEPRALATLQGKLGEPIKLPAAPEGTVLLAHVYGLQIGGFERMEMLFGRPEVRTISINGGRPYRVVPDTVQNGLIVSVPSYADFPKPFNLGMSATTLQPEIAGKDGDVTIELTAVPIRVSAEPKP